MHVYAVVCLFFPFCVFLVCRDWSENATSASQAARFYIFFGILQFGHILDDCLEQELKHFGDALPALGRQVEIPDTGNIVSVEEMRVRSM